LRRAVTLSSRNSLRVWLDIYDRSHSFISFYMLRMQNATGWGS
jgi:hypothetical protein